jgi:hypothetical protein
VLVLALCYCGDVENGEQATAPLSSIGNPIATHLGPTPYVGWQQAFDPLLTPGARNYWKSHDITDLSDVAIEILVDAIGRLPGPSGKSSRPMLPAPSLASASMQPHFRNEGRIL